MLAASSVIFLVGSYEILCTAVCKLERDASETQKQYNNATNDAAGQLDANAYWPPSSGQRRQRGMQNEYYADN